MDDRHETLKTLYLDRVVMKYDGALEVVGELPVKCLS